MTMAYKQSGWMTWFWLPFRVVIIIDCHIQVFSSYSLSSQSRGPPCSLTPFLGFQKDSTGGQALGGESTFLTPSVSTLLLLDSVHNIELQPSICF